MENWKVWCKVVSEEGLFFYKEIREYLVILYEEKFFICNFPIPPIFPFLTVHILTQC
jgi:hypothetical protein